MSEDKLEKYIRENRDSFDEKDVPLSLWDAIEKEVNPPPSTKLYSLRFFLSIAASVIILIGVGLGMGMYLAKPSLEDKLLAAHPDYLEAEKHYQHQINVKLSEVKSLGVDQYVAPDMSQLDAVYTELKDELLNSGVKNDKVIVEAMIDHYQSKLEVLEVVLNKLQNKNTFLNENNYENVEY